MVTPNFREARHTLGLTQQQAADITGVDLRTIKRADAGEDGPAIRAATACMLERLARSEGAPLSDPAAPAGDGL